MQKVSALLSDLKYDSAIEWMSHRPAPASSLPQVGAYDPTNLSLSAFGHQHMGLTGGPKTGRI